MGGLLCGDHKRPLPDLVTSALLSSFTTDDAGHDFITFDLGFLTYGMIGVSVVITYKHIPFIASCTRKIMGFLFSPHFSKLT